MPRQQVISDRRAYVKIKYKMTVTPRGISFHPSSNNTTSSPPYCVGSKRISVPEVKYNQELPAGVGDYSSCSPSVIYYDFKMGDMSGGGCFMSNHTLSQHYCDSNHVDVSSKFCF